jgi:YidC/Oxa1 family membrane protein insertase
MSNSPGASPPEPPSLQKRLPLALALMMLVLLVSQYLFKPAPGPKPVEPVNDKQAAQLTQKPAAPAAAALPPNENAAPAASGAQVHATSVVVTTVETDLYRIVFTNQGATVKSWVLKKFKDEADKPLELINLAATNVPAPFSIDFTGHKPRFDPNTVLYQAKVSPDGTSLEYEYSDGGTTVRKSFVFSKNSYLANVKSTVLEGNTPVPHVLTWRGGFGDQTVRGPEAAVHTVHYDTGNSKLITKNAKDAKNGPFSDSGNFTFGGLEDNFFAAVVLPAEGNALEVRTYSDDVKLPNQEKAAAYAGVGVASGPQNDLSLFVGPKDIDILRQVNPKLGTIIDWGFFRIIAKPLFLSLNWVRDHWTSNYGWAIIVVTLIINLALFPLRLTSLKSARKMQKLQPQIQAINARYKNISMRDPKKAEQNQEVMALYKQEGVNPVGGCIPMIIQLPFLYAFYQVLRIAIELRHAPWLWVTDLSAPETLPIHLLPVIMVGTQFFSQKLTPAAGVDPNQQRMMMLMPLIFGFMFYYLSSGLVLYYLTGNLVGIAQQLIINRFMPTPVAATAGTAANKGAPSKTPVKGTVKK